MKMTKGTSKKTDMGKDPIKIMLSREDAYIFYDKMCNLPFFNPTPKQEEVFENVIDQLRHKTTDWFDMTNTTEINKWRYNLKRGDKVRVLKDGYMVPGTVIESDTCDDTAKIRISGQNIPLWYDYYNIFY